MNWDQFKEIFSRTKEDVGLFDLSKKNKMS
jgi:hypothetical protein